MNAKNAKEYAKECGVELVGKLKRCYDEEQVWNSKKMCYEIKKTEVYWEDEVGNQINGNKEEGWCLITPNGDVY